MLPTDLTVSAVVERNGQFLVVEERASGKLVVNQPGGHIKAGETPEQAVARETLEEAGCVIHVRDLLGMYLWIHPQTRQNHLRIVFTAEFIAEDTKRNLDDVVHAVHWYTLSDLKSRQKDLRSPVVLRAVEDFLAGNRQPAEWLQRISPPEQNVDQVLARASLV